MQHNSNWNTMISDLLYSIIVSIGSAIYALCCIVFIIGVIAVIIDVLRGNKIQGPFFW